jgi:hypothetical protein
VGIAALLLTSSAVGQTASIQQDDGALKVSGWTPASVAPSDGWSSIFAVYTGSGDLPPVLGSYNVERGTLVFRPRFPLTHVRIRAVFRPPSGPPIEAVFEPPKRNTEPTTRVLHVFPSASVLPANQLKFYLVFSAPMQRGDAWSHIHLLDQSGKPIDLPFLELDQELWDPSYKRLTVLFDPGRIKRGLLPRGEAGPVIEDGKKYTLVVDQDWKDANGLPLQQESRKLFYVGPEDREQAKSVEWRLQAPKSGTSNALVLTFPEPMDEALLERLVEVVNAEGRVKGEVSIAREETEWRFVPEEPWTPGKFRLQIDTALEDLAGNRIGRAFDVDTFDRVSERLSRKTITLPFEINRQ